MKRCIFAIDTDTYAGSFERHLCGYLTGRFNSYEEGPDGHGSKEAAVAKKELPRNIWKYFEDHVVDCLEQPDDVPIHTPVVVYPTPGWFNHGMGGHFRDGQEKEAFEDYKREVAKYKKEHKGTTLEAGDKLNKCPAYMSVAIFFDEDPPKNIIDFLKERSYKFAKEFWPKQKPFGHKLEVTGFRIVKEKTVTDEKIV